MKKFNNHFKLITINLTIILISILIVAFIFAAEDKNNDENSSSVIDETSQSEIESEQQTSSSSKPIEYKPSGGLPYITSYTVLDTNENELQNVKAGEKVKIVITLTDPRFLSDLTLFNKVDVKITSTENYKSPSLGDITIARVSGDAYNGTNDMRYAIVFNDITYLGGSNTLSFDLTYSDNSQALTSLNVGISACGAIIEEEYTSTVYMPIIMVTNVDYGEKDIVAGENFNLAITSYNTSQSIGINSIITEIRLPDTLSISNGSNSALNRNVTSDGTFTSVFNLSAQNTAKTGMAEIEIVYTYYVEGSSSVLTSTKQISIPIVQADRFAFSNLEIPVSINLEETQKITVGFINYGKDTLYNLSASINGENLKTTQQKYIGNILSGTQTNVDFILQANKSGNISGLITVEYEDAKGNLITQEKEYSISVIDTSIKEEPPQEIITESQEKLPSKSLWIILSVFVVIIIIAIIVVVLEKKKAHKRTMAWLEEEENDF